MVSFFFVSPLFGETIPILTTLRIMGSQNWWFGDPNTSKPIFFAGLPVILRVLFFRWIGSTTRLPNWIEFSTYHFCHWRGIRCNEPKVFFPRTMEGIDPPQRDPHYPIITIVKPPLCRWYMLVYISGTKPPRVPNFSL